MTKIGILMYARPSNTWYMFCLWCARFYLNTPTYTIYDVHREQLPPEFGQICHGGCSSVLKTGDSSLFDKSEDIEVPEDFRPSPAENTVIFGSVIRSTDCTSTSWRMNYTRR
jgi:hypothetical protein